MTAHQSLTFQRSGELTISWLALTHGKGANISLSVFDSGFQASTKAPIWKKGKQYLLGTGNSIQPLHWANVAQVQDMSNHQVGEGDSYTFFAEFDVFRTLVKIVGVKGGSVVTPGFGLKNLINGKQEWKSIYPLKFNGHFGIFDYHPDYALPVRLSVDYVPKQDTVPARVTFTFFMAGGVIGMQPSDVGSKR